MASTETTTTGQSSLLPPLPSPLPTPHPSFSICLPPSPPTIGPHSVFLAGSIEMGAAIPWQSHLSTLLSPHPITILNPRRGSWDPNSRPDISDLTFKTQVEWELDALDRCSVIAMFFDPGTKAPISLLELGLYAGSGRLVVCCPEGYWRRGNVQIVCARFGIPVLETLGELMEETLRKLREGGMRD